MKMLYELAQDYASALQKIAKLEACRNNIYIQIGGMENWSNAAVEIREQLQPYLPQILDGVIQKAYENAALTKQELDRALSKDVIGLKMVK